MWMVEFFWKKNILGILLLSEITYRYVEKIKVGVKSVIIASVTSVIIATCSFTIYLHAGVVRDVPGVVWDNISKDTEIWGIGTKDFGECNGIIYSKRFSKSYYEQCVELSKEYELLNEQWEESWGDHYINMIEYVRNEDGRIRVFTLNHKFISQDCEHLTQEGAKYYAEMINFSEIFI